MPASKYASKRYLLAASAFGMPNLLVTCFDSSRSHRATIQISIFDKALGGLLDDGEEQPFGEIVNRYDVSVCLFGDAAAAEVELRFDRDVGSSLVDFSVEGFQAVNPFEYLDIFISRQWSTAQIALVWSA